MKGSYLNPFSSSQFISRYLLLTLCTNIGLVMRTKQLIIHNKLSKMKSKILTACLQGNYRNILGEFSNTSLIPYFSDYKSTRCISRPLFLSCKMMIFSDALSISRLPQYLFFTYNCMNSYKIIDHIKSDKTKSKKLFQYTLSIVSIFYLKPETPTFNSWKCFIFVSKPM